MIKKITALIITVIMAAAFAGCSDNSAADGEIRSKMLGGWVPLDDVYAVYDTDGNLTSFSVYEFTDVKTKYHYVGADSIESWVVNEYTIKNGRYTVVEDGVTMYQDVYFTDEGNLVLAAGDMKDEFRPLTDEELNQYHIPLGITLASEIEDEQSESSMSE